MPTEDDPINMVSIFGGYAANNFGRKKAMLFFCLPLLIGWITITFSAGNVAIIIIGRLLKVLKVVVIYVSGPLL